MRVFLIMAAVALLTVGSALAESKPPPPWNLDQLFKTPAFEWADQKSPVHALFYTGEPFQGKPSRVFAYYATARLPKRGRSIPVSC